MSKKLYIKLLSENARVPQKAHETDGAYDVYADSIHYEDTGKVVVRLGFALEIPTGYRVRIVPRSSLTTTWWVLQNSPAIVDAGYRGEYMLRFAPLLEPNTEEFPFKTGERCAQLYLEEEIPIEFVVAEELNSSPRGIGGFGSTGYK